MLKSEWDNNGKYVIPEKIMLYHNYMVSYKTTNKRTEQGYFLVYSG